MRVFADNIELVNSRFLQEWRHRRGRSRFGIRSTDGDDIADKRTKLLRISAFGTPSGHHPHYAADGWIAIMGIPVPA